MKAITTLSIAIRSMAIVLAITGCRGATGRAERARAPTAVAPSDTVVASAGCREDNPIRVRLVRLAQSELIAHLVNILGESVVRGAGAPVLYLQGDHTNLAAERVINSVDFSSYRNAARALARRYVTGLPRESACLDRDGAQACVHGPLKTLMLQLFRGELQPGEWDRFRTAYLRFAPEHGPDKALEAVLTAALLSPQVLYRAESGVPGADAVSQEKPVAHTAAARRKIQPRTLSRDEAVQFAGFAVLGRAPDAVERAELMRFDGDDFQPYLARVARQWTRTPAFESRAGDFTQEWLGVSHLREKLIRPGITGGGEGKPDMSDVLIKEFNQFVQDNLLGEHGSFARLFTASETRYFPELEDIYGGLFVPPDRIVWDARERKGVLGLAGLLAAHAKEQSSDPVQRGMLVRQRILCEPMPPPIPNADIGKVGVTDQMQTRERYEALAAAPACRACHTIINPPGYLFESFDQFGRYREIEKGRPIDASGGISPFFGQEPYRGTGDWSGITQLADWLAQAPQARLCFARDFSNYFLSARVFDRTDGCGLSRVAARFVQNGKIAELVEDIVRSEVFRNRIDDQSAGVSVTFLNDTTP